MMETQRSKILRGLLGCLMLAGLTSAAPAGATQSGAQRQQDAQESQSEETIHMGGEYPMHAVVKRDADGGQWQFFITGNRHADSVAISVAEATAESCSTQTLYSTKVTKEELAQGETLRQAAFATGSFCVHLILEGTKKAEASVRMTHPAPVSEPDPTISPDPDPEPVPFDASIEYTGLESKDGKTLVPARCTDLSTGPVVDDPYVAEIDHQVLAGAIGPDHHAPFIYTSFYPQTLQVHQGDVVEWCQNGGYDWHSVTFVAEEMDATTYPEVQEHLRPDWGRPDETGMTAFAEEWFHGPSLGDPAKEACGSGPFMRQSSETIAPRPAQPICVLNDTDVSVGSSIFDRFFTMHRPSTFRTQIDIAPGRYRYHCNIHPKMHGFIEVLPAEEELDNPSVEELSREIYADYNAAVELQNKLSDTSEAYDHATGEWVVHVGAETHDHSVAIEQFLPSRIDVRKGDTVRYVAGMEEPNSVAFPGQIQGGFAVSKRCGPHYCETDVEGREIAGPPYGMVGAAFVWGCDPDDVDSGAPMIPASALGASLAWRANTKYGCQPGTGTPEMLFAPTTSDSQPAPGNLVSPGTFHNSGFMIAETAPDWFRKRIPTPGSDAPVYPSEFKAKFPAEGTYAFLCAAHEYMNGKVVVR